MNKIDELEYLLELQALTMGALDHNNIAINCKSFRAEDKETELRTEIIIKVNKTDWGISGKYIEEMLHDGKMRDSIDSTIVMRIKEIIKDKIKNIRKDIKFNLGITEMGWGESKEEQRDDIKKEEIGGSTK